MSSGNSNALLVGAVLALAACGPPPAATSQAAASAIVRISAGGVAVCAGVLVAPDLVLTAYHCIQPPKERKPPEPGVIEVSQASWQAVATELLLLSGQPISYEVVGDLQGRDLAVLRLPANTALREPAELSGASLAEGAHVWGFALQRGWMQVEVRRLDQGQVFVDGCTCDGDSGGGLFDVDDGSVMGIASWRDSDCFTGASVFDLTLPHREWLMRVGASFR